MKLQITRVIYSIKNDRGFIEDRIKTFSNHKDAVDYLLVMKMVNKLVGKPVLEVA